MRWFFSLILQKKYHVFSVYTIMVLLMLGTMAGLILISWWTRTRPSIIQAPASHYDYVIVGGGTAGCVLAARLSADPNRSVLLVEAGHEFGWVSTIPLAAPLLQNTAYDWSYRTTPQLFSSWGLQDQMSAWPRGRGLGGSSQMNYLLHFSGIEADFQKWEALGAHGWSYENLKPYIDQLLGASSCPNNYKDILIRTPQQDNVCHREPVKFVHSQNSKGLLRLTQADPEDSALTQAFLEAGRILRTAGEKIDFAPAQNTIHRGQRWSSMHAYLQPALGRPNLHVLLDTLVTKVLIKQNTTIGVEIQGPDGHKQSIHAYREVILSAGAINTPQILMLSGIGPWQQLEQFGIEVIADLPVGFGLHDHLNLPLYVSITAPVSVTLSKMQRLPELWQYMAHGKGYLASSAIFGVGSADPDLGLVLFGLGSTHEGLLRDIANFKSSTFRGLFPFSQNTSQEGFVLLASCLQPLSRGTVSIQSVDPTRAPVIDPQYLIHPYDVTCMTKAVRLAVRVVDMAPFQILGAKLYLPRLDECRHLVPDVWNDVYVECIVRTAAITGHHPAGTCKMGSPTDPAAVVDPLLRVRGIEGLRVVDASVMPTPISGHPNSVLMAMADRAASLISNS